MKRRQFVAGASSAVLATQTGMRGSGTDSQSYEALESDALPTDVTVAWIVDRFVQVQSENAPVVGTEVTVPGYVLERVRSLQLGETQNRSVTGNSRPRPSRGRDTRYRPIADLSIRRSVTPLRGT